MWAITKAESCNQLKLGYCNFAFIAFLVLLFFITLYRRPASLYAPSDYRDESNFVVMNSRMENVSTGIHIRVGNEEE